MLNIDLQEVLSLALRLSLLLRVAEQWVLWLNWRDGTQQLTQRLHLESVSK
jgi:hypothetical protein